MRGSRPGPFAARLALLAVCLFAFDRGAFVLLNRLEGGFYRDPAFEARYRNFIRDRRFDTLILGTSRAYEAIHPPYFRARGRLAFKEAFFGRLPKYNQRFYRFFKEVAGVPELVIYGMDYFTFQTVSNKRWLARFNGIHGRTGIFSAPSLLLANKTDVEAFLADAIARADGEPGTARTGGGSPDPGARIADIQDYVGSDSPPEIAGTAPPSFRKRRYRGLPGREGDAFIRLLDELAADGVKVVLAVIPDHIGTFRTHGERGKFLAELDGLARRYPNVRVVNFNRPDRFPLDRDDFFINGGYDMVNSHMSRAGAELYNRLLLDEIAAFAPPPAGPAAGAAK